MAPDKIINNRNGKESPQILNADNVNPFLKGNKLESIYPLMCRATEIQEEIENGAEKPFSEVVRGFLGDHHAMGQTPISFVREVLALVTCPSLMVECGLAADVKGRARTILASCAGGSIGAYSADPGIAMVRQHVAEFIAERDGVPCDWNNVILTNGATTAIECVLRLLMAYVDGKRPGVMSPLPLYPLYTGLLAKFNMQQIDYYLDEDQGWGLNVKELKRAINEARKHCNPRAIVVINPGNPTGHVLCKNNIKQIIEFAYNEDLLILADEVYQDNVYAKGSQFHSFKKVLTEMGPPYSHMELASFMSCSKGYVGECGLRGGYVEFINLRQSVRPLLNNAFPLLTCPTTIGQAMLDCVVKPPRPGEASYQKFHSEKTAVLRSLAERAKLVTDAFNGMEGVSCNEVQGAMYAFPQIKFSPKAITAAEKAGMAPDAFFAFALLEKTGVCILPGTSFRQKPGTYHIRTTILLQPDKLKIMLEKFRAFYEQFVEQYK